MDFAHGYVAQVDRILAAAVSLFPAESLFPADVQAADLQRGAAPTVGDLPGDVSGLATAAEEAAGRYRSDDARASALSDALNRAVKEAAAHAQQAHESARTISQAAATGARTVLAEGGEPHNLVLLVSQMDARLAAMQEHIDQTRQRLLSAAQRIQSHGAEMAATQTS